jgi:outer membrane protein
MENRNSSIGTLAGHLHGASIGGQYRFAGGIQVGLNLEYQVNRAEGIHPLFFVNRQDARIAGRVEITNAGWSWNGFAPVLQLSAERQRSNIVITITATSVRQSA